MRFQLGLTLLALALGLFKLQDKGLWVDEAVSLRFALSTPDTWFLDHNMALFYALLSVVVRVFGDSEQALRALSVASFVASVPAFYALLRRAFDVRVARIGCALFVSNAYLLHFAQEARGYMLAVLLSIIASHALLCLIELRTRSWACGYSLAIALSSYAHAFALWVLLAHGLCALWFVSRERALLRPLSLAFGLAAGFVLPLVLHALSAGAEQISWITRPSWPSCLALATLFAGGNTWLAELFGALFVFFLALTLRRLRSMPVESALPYVLCASWFLVPVGTTLIISCFATPIVHPKYLLVALPGLLAGVAVCVERLRSRLVQNLTLLVLLALSTHGLYDWYAHYEKERWRELVTHLRSVWRAGDALVLDVRAPEALDYYVLHAESTVGHPPLPPPLFPDRAWSVQFTDVREHGEREQGARFAAAGRIWLVRNRSHDLALRAQIAGTHWVASSLALEPRDGDNRSLFASSEGRIIYLESFVPHTPR